MAQHLGFSCSMRDQLMQWAKDAGFSAGAAAELGNRSLSLPAILRPIALTDPERPGCDPVDLIVLRDGCGSTLIDGPKNRKWAGLISWAQARQVEPIVLRGGRSSAHLLLGVLLLSEAGIDYRVQFTSHHAGNGAVRSPTEALLNAVLPPHQVVANEWSPPAQACVLPEGGWHPASLVGLLSLALLVDAALRARHKACHLVIDSGSGATALGLLHGLTRLQSVRHIPSLTVHIVHIAGGAQTFEAQMHQATLPSLLTSPYWPRCAHHTPLTGRSFGSVNRTVRNACAHFTREAGIFFDPIYTAKTALVARQIARSNPRSDTLLIHSGGTLNLCGYLPLTSNVGIDIDTTARD
jgi:1-aminocyclopropane-1-carboxylate deaminase/D-cysteine desulfhydrase-like pyridoxal-dependent ACC family enzyme